MDEEGVVVVGHGWVCEVRSGRESDDRNLVRSKDSVGARVGT